MRTPSASVLISCGCPVMVSIQGQVGRGFEQLELWKDVPACGTGVEGCRTTSYLWSFQSQTILSFYERSDLALHHPTLNPSCMETKMKEGTSVNQNQNNKGYSAIWAQGYGGGTISWGPYFSMREQKRRNTNVMIRSSIFLLQLLFQFLFYSFSGYIYILLSSVHALIYLLIGYRSSTRAVHAPLQAFALVNRNQQVKPKTCQNSLISYPVLLRLVCFC